MKYRVFKFLWPYFYKLRFLFSLSLATICIGETFSRIGAYYGSRLIGLISSNPSDRHSIISLALVYIFAYVSFVALRGIVTNFSIRIDANFLPSLQAKIYKDLFAIAHKHSPAYFEQEMSGNIASKIENIVVNMERFYYVLVWGIFNPLVVLLISMIAMAFININLSLILFAMVMIFIYLTYKSSRYIMPYTKETAKLNSQANGELVDSLINAESVKSYGRRFYENQYYFKKILKAGRAERREYNASGLIYIVQSMMRSLIQAVMCIMPLYFWYKDQLNIADFVFVQSIVVSLIWACSSMIDVFLKIFSRYSIIKDGLDLLFKPYGVVDKKDATTLDVEGGAISFEKITYGYEGIAPIFKDFSLTIEKKQKIGLVGCSGSGKSTLIKLLNRYYALQDGCIKIDEQDIADVTELSLHKNIAMIPQEPNLFNRTIMENIRYGNLHASDEEVFAAAKKAYCHDFILALPKGYKSKVGERGIMLSGGERQRIAIARAILKNAPILVLDEATSALDSESERYIQNSLAELMEGRTVVAIAHRLSTLKRMDKIVVLEQGKIAEIGTHNSLQRKKGIYHKFYTMQTSHLKIK